MCNVTKLFFGLSVLSVQRGCASCAGPVSSPCPVGPQEGCEAGPALPSWQRSEPVRLWTPTPTSTPALLFQGCYVFDFMGESLPLRNV